MLNLCFKFDTNTYWGPMMWIYINTTIDKTKNCSLDGDDVDISKIFPNHSCGIVYVWIVLNPGCDQFGKFFFSMFQDKE